MNNAGRSLRFISASVLSYCLSVSLAWGAPPRVLDEGKLPADSRLGQQKTYNEPHHPWTAPTSLDAWEAQKPGIRERMLVGMGLWPMPPAAPLKPVIHGKIDRDDYTIEKVFFASHPGFYVTGSLYRPKKIVGKIPGVLCPHGHWANGRFYELSADKAQSEQIAKGAEKFLAGAQYPLQARCVHLARLGCTVFHYDMVGNADSQQIAHREGFTDVQATMYLQDFMGLQTFNSMRALDFVLSLPEVDSTRIGVTGASGGGTQTFVLGALDPRPTAAFPAVMVSTAMQGGCVCENCSYLRIGQNNIAMTALFAPKPLAMSAANDWTLEIEKKGLPELKQIYALYGKPENVAARTWPEFDHNYNQPAREMMYGWFNKHLKLGKPEPIVESDFRPVPPKELSVFDAEHPRPADSVNAEQLKAHLRRVSQEQFAALLAAASMPKGMEEYRRVVGGAARVMFGTLPEKTEVAAVTPLQEVPGDGFQMFRVSATRRGADEQIPIITLVPSNFNGSVVLWIDDAGKRHLFDASGSPNESVRKLLTGGTAVASVDLFQTGEFLPDGQAVPTSQPVNATFAGYTFGYNRPLIANRVRDLLTVLGGLANYPDFRKIHLVGTGNAGVWALLARAQAGDRVDRCLVDLKGFGFSKIEKMDDPNMLPGGLRYGGLGGLAALAFPNSLSLYGVEGTPEPELKPLSTLYQGSTNRLQLIKTGLVPADVVAALQP